MRVVASLPKPVLTPYTGASPSVALRTSCGAGAHAGAAGRIELDHGALAAAQAAQLRERELAGDERLCHPSIGNLR